MLPAALLPAAMLLAAMLLAAMLLAGQCLADYDNAPASDLPIPGTNPDAGSNAPPTSVGEPVNAGSGEAFFREPGLSWPCPGLDLGFEIHYRSATNYLGPLSPGWDHSLNWRLSRIWEVNGKLTPPAPPPPPLAEGSAPTYRVAGRYAFGAALEWPYTMVDGGRLLKWPAQVEGSLLAGTNGLGGPRLPLCFGGGDIGNALDNYAFTGSVFNRYWVSDGERFYSLTGSNGVYRSAINSWELREEPDNRFVLYQPNGVKRFFGTNGLLQSVSDAWSNSIALTRDSQGNLTEARHSNGRVLAFVNDASGRLAQASGGTQSLSFNYDTNGLLTELVWQGGDQRRTNRYAYGQGLVTTRTPAAGSAVQYTYLWTNDVWNMRVARATQTVMGSNGYLTALSYNGQVSEVTSYDRGLQWRETYYFTNNARLALRAGPWLAAGNQAERGTAYIYDSAGNRTQSKDFQPDSPFWMLGLGYDDRHQVASLSVGYGTSNLTQLLSIGWDAAWQQPAWLADAMGKRVDLEYNQGRVSRVRESGGGETNAATVSYESRGLPAQAVNANGQVTEFSFDGNGRPQRVKPGAGPAVWAEYDSEGRLTQAGRDSSPAPLVAYGRNGFGWVTNATYADGLGESFQYDGLGRVTGLTDRAGRTTRVARNELGEIASVTRDANGLAARIEWLYDQQANGLVVKDELGRAVESYELDLRGRPVTVTNVEGQTMSVTYGVGNFVKTMTRFDGSAVSNDYDTAGRVSQVSYPDGALTFGYLDNGLLKTAGDSRGIISNEYNGLNRLTKSCGLGPNSVVSYGYYPAGQVSVVTSAAGTVSYSLDAGDRLSSIASPADTFNYSYNTNNGLLSGVTSSVGASVAFTYDVLDRVTNIVWQDSTNGTVMGFAYQFNSVGMITNVTRENGERASFTYDMLDRLAGEQWQNSTGGVAHSASYQYDLVGNRTQAVINGQTINYTLSANRLLSWGTNGSQQFDAAGNVTNLQDDSDRQLSLTWDSRYRLTSVYTNGGLAESYEYDALGRRVSISDGISTNFLIYDGAQVIAEVSGDGSLKRSYVWSSGIDNLLSMTVYGATTSTYYAVKDHLGSVHALVDSSGAIVESYKYDAWGNVQGIYDSTGGVIQASAIGNRYLWTGREYSFKSKLYFHRTRWHEPSIGRWLSPDSIGISGGLNLYEYVRNNPVNFVDPFGLAQWNPVVHHIGSDGRPVYDGQAFLRWYVNYLLDVTIHPFDSSGRLRLWQFLQDVDIKVYSADILPGDYFYYNGECVRKDEMGNIAAGYAMQLLWGSGPTFAGSVIAEIGGAMQDWDTSDPIGINMRNAIINAYGSWTRNAQGSLDARITVFPVIY